MADVTFQWHGNAIMVQVKTATKQRLKASAIVVANRAKELISTAYPPASSPGEPPAKRSGHLRRSVATEPGDGLTYRVGTGVWYGRRLELGDSGVEARPWLRPALMQSQQKIEAILGAPIV